jgi:hypothetical protein
MFREFQLVLGKIEGDDPGRGDRAQDLDRHVAQSPGADDHCDRARCESLEAGLDRVIRREAGVGQGDVLHRIEVAERHQMPGIVGDQVLGHRARSTETWRTDAECGGVLAVILFAERTVIAVAASPRPIDGNRIADLDADDPLTQLVDDACALVAQGQRQSERLDGLGRQAHQPGIRVARPGGSDFQPHLTGPRRGRRNLHHFRRGPNDAVLQSLHFVHPFVVGSHPA